MQELWQIWVKVKSKGKLPQNQQYIIKLLRKLISKFTMYHNTYSESYGVEW